MEYEYDGDWVTMDLYVSVKLKRILHCKYRINIYIYIQISS